MSKIIYRGISATILRSCRKTISVQIKRNVVIVRAPEKMSDQEIISFLERKWSWISKHIILVQQIQKQLEGQKPYTYDELKALAATALQVIPEKVKHYAELIGVDYGKITIRNQKTRWGSCSSKGNLNFNCLLMLLPEEVIDSVVVHELCHRKHMNHSQQFYAEIDRVFPHYKKCHDWLNQNGGLYLSRLP